MSSSNSFYRCVLNPVMRSLLRSPLHGITSHNIGIVHFSARKSGRKLSTSLSYTREGNIVRLLSNHSTQWWLNFREDGVKVEMEIARQRYPGTAILLEGDSEALRKGVRRFIHALPHTTHLAANPEQGMGGGTATTEKSLSSEIKSYTSTSTITHQQRVALQAGKTLIGYRYWLK